MDVLKLGWERVKATDTKLLEPRGPLSIAVLSPSTVSANGRGETCASAPKRGPYTNKKLKERSNHGQNTSLIPSPQKRGVWPGYEVRLTEYLLHSFYLLFSLANLLTGVLPYSRENLA